MVELIDNLVQLLVTLTVGGISGYSYARSGKQEYFLLTCLYGCCSLSQLYWTLYLLLLAETPPVFYVSEIGWISGVLFLHILQDTLGTEEERSFRSRTVWLAPAVGIPLTLFYCTYGDMLVTLVWCGALIWVTWCSIRALAYLRAQGGGSGGNARFFHWTVLVFAAAEYGLWTASCIWSGETLCNPYFWFDFLLTAATLLLLPATKKAVGP